ncbi:MAG TPA: sugar phosphate isomerase/epimerase [Kiritimatiellia bacterium]|nr:sugar phosphate isomerase/epimerase [Kiritimatiellia bacterium]HPS08119.1 sugar phosphate isomerase/epimerase [Kiritimatiellia bacterium]
MTTRRSFFKQAGLGLAAAAGTPALITAAAHAQDAAPAAAPFKIAIAGYTFHKFKLDKEAALADAQKKNPQATLKELPDQTLEMLKRIDVHYLCIKDFHLPLKSTDEEIAAFHEKCKSFGVTGYGVGPIYMGSEEEVNAAFAYAKRVGVKVLVGVPFKMVEKKRCSSPELLKLIDAKVKEYDIKYAIHNHGPDMPELFPNAESGIELIKDMDKRVGLCLDIGHQFRDGKDPVKAITDYADRIHDIHIKNVTEPTKKGHGIEIPRGAIDFPAVVRALRKVGYTGACSLEYEKDMSDPLLGIAESIGYFRGVVDATR